jgi:hypothetical protein
LRDAAPVNEPLSWPKSSLSRRLAGSPAQFTVRNAIPERLLHLWRSRATSSLPVPVSPSISTAQSVGPTFRMSLASSRILPLFPMMSGKKAPLSRKWSSVAAFLPRVLFSCAFRMAASSSSKSNGFVT